SLSGVGQHAFENCLVLKSVSIKSGGIGELAFQDCTNLITVSLLDGVTGIGIYAFNTCSKLTDITVKWTKAEEIPSINWNVFDGVDRAKATLHIPSYTTEIYKAKDVWNSFNIVEDINFIITKTDDTKIEQKVVDNGSVTIDERSRNIKSLVVSEEVENVSVTYIRNFANAGKWQAWYVPFDVSVSDMDQAGLDVAEIYGILLDKDNKAVIAFLKMDAGTVKANTPYVVRPKEYGDVTVTTTTTLYQTKATQFAINSAKDTYTIGGIYEQTTTPGNWYAVNTSGQFQKMGTGVNLQPMRIWMTIDPRDDNPYTQPSEANAKMNIMVIGDDESTGIESLAPTLSESDGAIYNLQGQRVTSIQKGQVYIMNGKKFFAR
ncbi:MAG: leucine-rich repeat protein, partial [Prevotellaceae bacterium]|nr:leucine-rich repeat protein [Prevotellaceae bacterium]